MKHPLFYSAVPNSALSMIHDENFNINCLIVNMNMKFPLKLTIVWRGETPSSSPCTIKHFMDLDIVDYGWLRQFYSPLNEM